MSFARGMLKELGTYPTPGSHGQMDVSVHKRINELAVKPDLSADDLRKLLDDCCYGSLCTDFIMIALDIIWKDLKQHGTSILDRDAGQAGRREEP